ncbi:MAG: isochorismatase hydrolase [Massilibacillus sp.]|jgi:nicotinamidase/pyrazinamidase|nr:isochorismatase hydrolase [Massilibacillus sp.]
MRKALLVVDMLKDFINPEGALFCGMQGQAIVPFIKEKITESRLAGDTIIFICDRHESDDVEFNRFPAHCIAGTVGAEVVEELQFDGYDENITGKQRYSGFYNTDLDEQLEMIDEIAVVGVCTNICVLFTVEELCNRNKKVIVYREAVASFDIEAHEYALKQMETVLGAEIK